MFGIVNGTTNYMLREMAETGAEYATTLKQAQELGYAEADPTEDVGGKDAAAKMAILASIAFHSRVTLDDVQYEGIDDITDIDMPTAAPRSRGQAARRRQAHRRRHERARVPGLPARGHPLAGVTGAYNAVFLESETFDKIMLFGPGAGSTPTASAVIGDIISIVNTAQGSFVHNCLCYKDVPFFPNDEIVSRFYLRLRVADEPGVLARSRPFRR